ncbi:DUF4185 domain-containing protein [Nocardia huaxiensis]|uniref:DUF4185 domain-containing protein n=1 Tax=Nocardia huaxiensis TaxID=2755382 RepID=A0A7D6Z4T2_9NOCA|nr:DUF4185 domain-containing protein [Nocardia huaxiensis]QLY32846.1 DUF4185 domain-containing protein [Nocardia huaxiensis]
MGIWTRRRRLTTAATVLFTASAVGCSSTAPQDTTAQPAPAALTNQQSLEMPTGAGDQMLVPPAPGLPQLAAGGNPGGVTLPNGAAPPNFPGLSLTPNNGGTGLGTGVAAGGGQPQVPQGATVTNAFVSKVTGAGSTSTTDVKWGVSGAGYAAMWDDGNGRVLTAFGDTFGGTRPGTQQSDQPPLISSKGLTLPVIPELLKFPGLPFLNLNEGDTTAQGNAGDTGTQGPRGFDWRSNTLAVSTNRDLEKGMQIESFVEDRSAHAGQVLSSRKVDGVEVTTLPTSGLSVGSRQYMGYSSIREWGSTSGSWVTNYSGIAYSDDGGQTWVKDKGAVWVNSGAGWGYQMPALAKGPDGFVYLYGTPQGRIGGVFVARVTEDRILDKNAYEHWTGTEWTNDPTTPSAVIVSGAVGEASVQFHPGIGRWLLTYTDILNNGIVMRQAVNPQGPWTDPEVIASGKDYPYIYGAHMHPWSSGNDLFFTVSQWSTYNVFLMHTTVVAKAAPAPEPSIPAIYLHGVGGIPAITLPDAPGPGLPNNLPFVAPDFPAGMPTGPDE